MPTLLCDLDDTLFDHSGATRDALAAMRRHTNAFAVWPLDEFDRRHRVVLETLHLEVLAGRYTVEQARVERFRRLLADAGHDERRPDVLDGLSWAYRSAYERAWRMVDGAVPLVAAARARGWRVAIVTNNVTREQVLKAIEGIKDELRTRLDELVKSGKLVEAQRLEQRTMFDLEMIEQMGFCSGIENYSRHLTGRAPGEPPPTLLDYFPDDFLLVIDESHVAVPQLHGQYLGDLRRKDELVEHGFRLPSARDNRPLRFDEVLERINQCVFMSATPGPYELRVSSQVVEQIRKNPHSRRLIVSAWNVAEIPRLVSMVR